MFFAQIKVSRVGLYGLRFYWFQLTNKKEKKSSRFIVIISRPKIVITYHYDY